MRKGFGWAKGAGLAGIALLVAACAVFNPKATTVSQDGDRKPIAVATFEDITVPPELTPDYKSSVLIQTARQRSGVLVYTGRISEEALVGYFRETMPAQGWNLLGSFQGNGSTLVFTKSEKLALVTVRENEFITRVEIKVGASDPGRPQEKKLGATTN